MWKLLVTLVLASGFAQALPLSQGELILREYDRILVAQAEQERIARQKTGDSHRAWVDLRNRGGSNPGDRERIEAAYSEISEANSETLSRATREVHRSFSRLFEKLGFMNDAELGLLRPHGHNLRADEISKFGTYNLKLGKWLIPMTLDYDRESRSFRLNERWDSPLASRDHEIQIDIRIDRDSYSARIYKLDANTGDETNLKTISARLLAPENSVMNLTEARVRRNSLRARQCRLVFQ